MVDSYKIHGPNVVHQCLRPGLAKESANTNYWHNHSNEILAKTFHSPCNNSFSGYNVTLSSRHNSTRNNCEGYYNEIFDERDTLLAAIRCGSMSTENLTFPRTERRQKTPHIERQDHCAPSNDDHRNAPAPTGSIEPEEEKRPANKWYAVLEEGSDILAAIQIVDMGACVPSPRL